MSGAAAYDNQLELEKYCINDTLILALECMSSVHLLLEKGGINPFSCCMTQANLSTTLFRMHDLREYHDIKLVNGTRVDGVKVGGKLYTEST